MIRMLQNKEIKIKYLEKYLIFMRNGGTSTAGIKGYIKNLQESHQVLVKNHIKFPYIVDFLRIIKTINQILLAEVKSSF